MAYRWKSTNNGCLKIGQGKNKKIFTPGEVIPDEYVGGELLARMEAGQIEEFVREKVIEKPKIKMTKKEEK